VCKNAEAGQSVGKPALVIRFVTARLNAATPLFAEPDQEDEPAGMPEARRPTRRLPWPITFYHLCYYVRDSQFGKQAAIAVRVLRFGLLQDGDVGVGILRKWQRHSLGQLATVGQELLLAIHCCGTDFLELGGMAQWRKQRIGIKSGIRAKSVVDCLTEQPQRNLIPTAESFDFRCTMSNFRIRKRKTMSAIGKLRDL
jgi:hypothetical protein